MMVSFKKLITIFAIVLAIRSALGFPINAFAQENAPVEFHAQAKAAISVDVETGKIFYAQNADEQLPIASITKLITAYIVLQEVSKGSISWLDEVPISLYAHLLSVDWRLSGVPLELERTYTVKELFDALLIPSSNGAAVALAEKIAGSEQVFVQKMHDLVESFGIEDAHIVNASGIDNSFVPIEEQNPNTAPNDETKMSARSVAILARRLLKDFPEVLEITQIVRETFGIGTASQVEMLATNQMLSGMFLAYDGMDGLKTGTSVLAGQSFVGTAQREDWRILTVVLNADESLGNFSRFIVTRTLMDFTFENWTQQKVLTKGATFTAARYFPVYDGKAQRVPLHLAKDVTFWVQSGMNTNNLHIVFNNPENDLIAPIEEGKNVGTVSITLVEDTHGYLEESLAPSYIFPMRTAKSVERDGFFPIVWRRVFEFISWYLT